MSMAESPLIIRSSSSPTGAIRYYQMWLDAEPDNTDAEAGLEKAKAAKQQ